jgi:ATP-dependent DNA helicase RecG
MFCSNPDEAGAVIYQYRVTPGGEPTAVHRLHPPILQSFPRTMELLHARQETTPLNLPSGQQIAIEDFPSDAVREALSNAICHRDYHLTGPVHIEHSPTVFNVVSPGPLVAGVTMANIITTPSRPRNAALLRIARHLGLAEELGRGVDRMYREMIRSGLQAPKILGEFDHVKVTLVGGAPDTNMARFIAGLPEHEQNDTDTMLILLRLCQTKTITAAAASTILQKSENEAEAVLRRLSEDGVELLERTRATEGRSSPTYRLKSASVRGLGSAVKYSRRSVDDIDRKVISHVQEYGRITNRTIQNFLDVHVFKARDIISHMVQRGVLKRISQQQRGPKVEWGPGPNFPMTNSKPGPAKQGPSGNDEQGSLFS